MKHDDRKRVLQEYLDGRLSKAARAEFERRCERDEDLADRVRVAREIRQALREPVAELSDEFHAGTLERFERTGPARRRWWPGLLSWEAAGLAAAVALAAVLYLPPWIDPDGAMPAGEPTPARGLGTPGADETPVESHAEPFADDPPRDLSFSEKKGDPPKRAPKGGQRRAAIADTGSAHRTGELRGPVVSRGEVRIVDTDETWRDLFGGRTDEALPPDFAFEPGERWVVIGPRSHSISCAAVAVNFAADEITVRPMPAKTRSGTSRWGCVVIVPADRRPVRFVEPEEAAGGS